MRQELSLFDFHCDTALRMFEEDQGFLDNPFHICARRAGAYQQYAQIAAIFCPHHLTDEEGYAQFFRVMHHLQNHLDSTAVITDSPSGISEIWATGKIPLIPAVEDARILAGHIDRLSVLRKEGVRVLTLLWKDETCIGGAYNTNKGLTPFGKQVVHECAQLGVVPDVSHASEQSTEDICDLAESLQIPCIASHSDSYSVHPHPRNLRDHHFKRIRDMGGIVGLNLCTDHLGSTDPETVFAHAERYLELGGENTLCLGCDLDGTDLPDGIRGIEDLSVLADIFARHHYSDELIQKIFWKNAVAFWDRENTGVEP